MKTLSSMSTVFPKYVLPAVWLMIVLVLGVTTLDSLIDLQHAGEIDTGLLLKMALITPFILWGSTLFRVVRVDSRNLYVTRFWRVAIVPLPKIAKVSQTTGMNPHVTIDFDGLTAAGRSISFLPVFGAWSFTHNWRIGELHPVVAELQGLVSRARAESATAMPTVDAPA